MQCGPEQLVSADLEAAAVALKAPQHSSRRATVPATKPITHTHTHEREYLLAEVRLCMISFNVEVSNPHLGPRIPNLRNLDHKPNGPRTRLKVNGSPKTFEPFL